MGDMGIWMGDGDGIFSWTLGWGISSMGKWGKDGKRLKRLEKIGKMGKMGKMIKAELRHELSHET